MRGHAGLARSLDTIANSFVADKFEFPFSWTDWDADDVCVVWHTTVAVKNLICFILRLESDFDDDVKVDNLPITFY